MGGVFQVEGSDRGIRVVVDELTAGWSTRSFPHLIDDKALYVADNVVFNRDGLISKRPGNTGYAYGSGATGSGHPIQKLARFYSGNPQLGTLVAQSNGSLYKGNDTTGAFTAIATGLSTAQPMSTAQMYDPDMTTGGATALFVCDGQNVPHVWDGTHYVPVQTAASGGSNFLPTGRAGNPITPKYCIDWNYHMVYGGQPDEPTAIYISDALRPERFNGYGLLDSAGTPYTAYFPAGRDGTLGVVTGFAVIGPFLVIFFTAGIATAFNTGSYGAFQYIFQTISRNTGAVADQSIVPFEGFACFFAGDRFYATDGQTVSPLPDEVPSVYADNSTSAFPSEMAAKSSVVGVRRGQAYWAAYDNVGTGENNSIVVFDTGPNGGWTYGASTGGAWSRFPTGMPLSCGLECRGPGDFLFPLFWGSSQGDLVAQHDAPLHAGVSQYADFGQPIAVEIRAKAFFLDKPIYPKKILGLYCVCAFPSQGVQYADTIAAYVIGDNQTYISEAEVATVVPVGTPYGGSKYGTFTYGSGMAIEQETVKTYPSQQAAGNSIQPGLTESSVNPFNLISFVMELVLDEPPL